MHEPLVDVGAELLAALLYLAGAGLLTALGLFAEYNGMQSAAAGQEVTALWFAYMGMVALVAGLSLVRDKLLRPVLA